MRILLFLGMQLGVLVVVSIVGSILLSLFGIRIGSQGYIGMWSLFLVMGFAGSFISLFLSKTMCIKAYNVQLINNPTSYEERMIFKMVGDLAYKAQLPMPEVGIYDSADPNAFATGYSKNNALVAVSTGLLRSMNEEEVRGVIGHEISHIKNGDMVTMCLLQGVLNTFVYAISYIVAQALTSINNQRSEEGGSSSNFFMFTLVNSVCQILFGFVASLIMMWYSRHREFGADELSARLTSPKTMISSLEALRRGVQPSQDVSANMQAMCINSVTLGNLLSSHPPLEKRIEALRNLRY